MYEIADQLNTDAQTNWPTRQVHPPQRVLARTGDGVWRLGNLDYWLRPPEGWYGRVTLDTDATRAWYSATELRRAN